MDRGDVITAIDQTNITESQNVHIGNISYIEGPININIQAIQQNFFIEAKPPRLSISLPIIERRIWLAQPSISVKVRHNPADQIVISCSETESSTTQAGNTLTIRMLQTFHIEGLKLGDIAQNFLIGCDGQVYEGRGWKRLPEDSDAIQIGFIGTFHDEIPELLVGISRKLIEMGIELGFIKEKYSVVGRKIKKLPKIKD